MVKIKNGLLVVVLMSALASWIGYLCYSLFMLSISDWGTTNVISCDQRDTAGIVRCINQQARFLWHQPETREVNLRSVAVGKKSIGDSTVYVLYLRTDSYLIEINKYDYFGEETKKMKHQFDLLLAGDRQTNLKIKYGASLVRILISAILICSLVCSVGISIILISYRNAVSLVQVLSWLNPLKK